MKYIFEGNWIYLAHESQIPNVNDYYTLTMGRQPVVIARNRNGELNAFLNTCTHRGATLCRYKKGNKSTYTCPFHGWTFNNSGKLLKVKDPENAGYPDSFNCDSSHNLKHIAKFENYKGFLFGSLNPDVKPLTEFLGEATKTNSFKFLTKIWKNGKESIWPNTNDGSYVESIFVSQIKTII